MIPFTQFFGDLLSLWTTCITIWSTSILQSAVLTKIDQSLTARSDRMSTYLNPTGAGISTFEEWPTKLSNTADMAIRLVQYGSVRFWYFRSQLSFSWWKQFQSVLLLNSLMTTKIPKTFWTNRQHRLLHLPLLLWHGTDHRQTRC